MGGYEQHFGLRERAFEPAPDRFSEWLEPAEIEPYLVERLRAAGWEGAPVLDLGLAPLLYEATGGERAGIDRAMTALLEDAAGSGRSVIDGDGLAAWLDGEQVPGDSPAAGLAEAQLEAIEGAFAEHERALARLRRELADLREGSPPASAPVGLEERLGALETRLDQQDAALRHVLERLIEFFEREGPGRR